MKVRINEWTRSYANLAELMILHEEHRAGGFKYSERQLDKAWQTWVTEDPIRFGVVDDNGTNRLEVIEPGFMSDFASVPRLLRWYVSRNGSPIQVAAVIHDFLYSARTYPRAYADRVFYVTLRALQTPAVRARILWLAVRLGGLGAYRTGQRRRMLDGAWRWLDERGTGV